MKKKDRQKKDDDSKREWVMRELFRPGAWMQYPKLYHFFLSPLDSSVLAYLVGLSDYCKRSKTMKKKDDRLWFFCTGEKLKKEINLGEDQQKRSFRRLTQLGVVEIRKMGMPAKRYVWIDWGRIQELMIENAPERDNDEYDEDWDCS